jgi:4'-phosphopantetheinyl transferase
MIWQQAPEHPLLVPQDVHVWRAFFDAWQPSVPLLTSVLQADERERASRFYFEKDRLASIISRGLLRILLGRYCALDPQKLVFSYNEYGKPVLVQDKQPVPLYFNLAHSHNTVVYAFTFINSVGIDVEYMRSNIEYEQLAQHYFSPMEITQLQAVPDTQKSQAFYAGWTRKEAYIKARGKGLSIALDSFDVTLQPDIPAKLVACREEPQAVPRWSLYALPAEDQYASALALKGQCEQLHYFQIHPQKFL